MNRTKRSLSTLRADDIVLGAITVVLVVVADQLRGWPALILTVLAVGTAFGLLAGSVFDMPAVHRLPTRDGVRGHTRRAA